MPFFGGQAVFDELCEMLNPQKKPYVPKKGKPNVIMFVGLQVMMYINASLFARELLLSYSFPTRARGISEAHEVLLLLI
jgi:hypothetical protein